MSWELDKARLIRAITQAEGGADKLIKAVQCSIPGITTYPAAVNILDHTIYHALWDWVMDAPSGPELFIKFLGNRWAPIGVKNDPNHLNENWVPNVTSIFLSHGSEKSSQTTGGTV